ncbi:MAG: hypothetical protein ABI602_03120 [Candidatus Saccharibacteria bacterium]
MILSTAPEQLRRIDVQLRTAGMLKQTALIHDSLTDMGAPIAPISYFEIPPKAHEIPKLVIPYVHLLFNGFLDEDKPAIYGVTKNPNAFTNQSSEIRSREAHVYAEHLSLLRGIFTPFARANSEMRASRLIPADSYRESYIDDRIIHLQNLSQEIETSPDLRRAQRATAGQEIAYALRALRPAIELG